MGNRTIWFLIHSNAVRTLAPPYTLMESLFFLDSFMFNYLSLLLSILAGWIYNNPVDELTYNFPCEKFYF